MGAQEYVGALLDEECVLHVACGVFGREVQGREHVPVVLDLGPLGHGVAQPREDLDDLVAHERYGVARAYLVGAARAGHVAHGGRVALGSLLKGCLEGVYALLRGGFEGVETLPYLAFALGCDALELLHEGVQLAFFAEDPDTELLDFRRGLGAELLDALQQIVDSVNHGYFAVLYIFVLL